MLTQQARPKTFDEVAGQTLVKEALRAIIKNPTTAPKSIILQGGFGCGKSTQARIFAKAINCPHKDSRQNPCNKPDCPVCSQNLDNSMFYSEYDSSVIGSVEKIREIRDSFNYTIPNMYKVILIDECHLLSKQAASALLKVVEEAPNGIFYLWCTTHINNMLPTIRSRSLELRLSTVAQDDIVQNLKEVTEKFNVDVTEDILRVIATKSKGHMRNAHMLLDAYQLLGKESFLKSTRSATDAFTLYFQAVLKRDTNTLYKALSLLQTFPVADVKEDLNIYLFELTKRLITPDDSVYSQVAKALGANVFKIVKTYSSEWFSKSFENDIQMQTALLALFQLLTPQQSQSVQSKVRTK